jgi:general secretion pathway protein D
MQGIAVIETNGIFRVVPEPDAKIQPGPINSNNNVSNGEQVETQVFKLNFESAANLIPVLRPLISANNSISAVPNTNSLIITDYSSNLRRISRLISSLDFSKTDEIEIVFLKHALANEVVLQLNKLIEDRPGQPGQDNSQKVSIVADGKNNSILIRASNPTRIQYVKNLISKLDNPIKELGNIRVIYLKNAEAVKLVPILKSILTGETIPASTPTPSLNVPSNPMAQPGPMAPIQNAISNSSNSSNIISADPSTNSIIITAPEPVYRNLRSVIEKLDTRKAQIYIESLIIEVNAEKATELGIQWQFLGNPNSTGYSAIGGTNFTNRGLGSNIIDASANISSIAKGLNIGLMNGTTLTALARALETESGGNIIATPNLLTLDNEEAKIIIGQNVPFITGSFSNTGGAGAINPFQTIERKDVGTTLKVKPQVAESGTVRMQIYQEVSSVQDASLQAGLITNKRSIESNVLVENGQMIVLGGLIEERLEGSVGMVPMLGRLPIIGNLFRYDNRKKVKTNLMVFLRPVVLKTAEAADDLTINRYDYIRGVRQNSTPLNSPLIPEQQYQPNQLPNLK